MMLRKPTALLLAALALSMTDSVLAAGHGHAGSKKYYPVPPSAAHGGLNWGPGRARSYAPPVWIPGHEEQVTRSVWIPGRMRREWVPARIETRFDSCGRPFTVCVQPAHWRTVCDPGHFETVVETVWVPGRWQRAPC
jgi:hypothetical protein